MAKKTPKIFGIVFLMGLVFLAGYFAGNIPPPKEQSVTNSQMEQNKAGDAQLYSCPMHPDYIQEGPGTCPICGMDLNPIKNKKEERKIKHWVAPMDPSFISDKPGKSPMGMDLVPVYEEAGEEEGLVKIDPVTVQNIGVKTETVKKRPLHRAIRTVGWITYDERKIYHIHTKVTGWIDKLYVNFTGQKVRQGEPLISIYSPELVSTQQEYLQAFDYYQSLKKSDFEEISGGGKSLLEAARKRLELWDVTPAQIKKLEETREIQKNMVLYAPDNGIVVKMESAREGMYVQPGMNLYTIADISMVWVEADIYEYELPWVKVGQKASMTLSYYPEKEYAGTITFITPFLEQKTRTVKIRLEFDNPNLELKPDMYANIIISSDITKQGLAVPIQAVIHSGKRDVIIIDRGGGRFAPREVKVGAEAGDYYQILEGVKEGEKVVTSAQFLIDSESNLRTAISMMQEPEKEQTSHPDLDMSELTMEDVNH